MAAPALAAGDTAIQFDGVNDYVDFGAATSTLGTSVFTLEAWVKRASGGKLMSTGTDGFDGLGGRPNKIYPVLTKGMGEGESPATINTNWFLGITVDGAVGADFEATAGGGNHPAWGTTTVALNEWHHIAATYGAGCWALYVDGVAETVNGTQCPGATPEASSVQHAALGTGLPSSGTPTASSGYFAGAIDEARVWNVARSGTDILADKDSELTSGTGLVGRWGLNDGSGNTAANSITGSPDGTLTNGPTWVDGFSVVSTNTAPGAPTRNAPANAGTGVDTSPTLDVDVSDPDGDALTVTYFGRPYASGNYTQIAQHTGVASGGNDTATWSDIGAGQTFQWYVTVGDGTDTVTGPTWTFTTSPGTDPVFVGAGDIADCGRTQDEATGAIMSGILGNVWTAGDNVYPSGSVTANWDCYEASWGGAIKARTRPVPGNHDWGTGQGGAVNLVAYNAYFGPSATDTDGNSYYSYNIPDSNWHVVNLDTECAQVTGGCTAGSAQELWLKADLAANSTKNVIAVWHKPRFSSGVTNLQDLQPFWDDLYAAGVDVLLQGHDHIYERMEPIKSGATLGSQPVADAAYGIRQFTVGTGGASLQSCPGTPLATSEVCKATPTA